MDHAEEATYEMRGMVVEALIVAVDDTGQAQTVDVQTHDGVTRSGIEVRQFFGFSSAPPVAGATCLLLAVGGDPGHLVALPGTNPSVRFGNLAAGDGGCVYARDGSRVFVRAGGIVEIVGFTTVRIMGPGVTIEAPDGLAITGPTSIAGTLSVDGALAITGDAEITGNLSVSGTVSAARTNISDATDSFTAMGAPAQSSLAAATLSALPTSSAGLASGEPYWDGQVLMRVP